MPVVRSRRACCLQRLGVAAVVVSAVMASLLPQLCLADAGDAGQAAHVEVGAGARAVEPGEAGGDRVGALGPPALSADGSDLNPRVVAAEYSVRGTVVERAEQLRRVLADGGQLPFDRIVHCNIGNPQALQQAPLTFPRQVLAALMYPGLIDEPPASWPSDAVGRAKQYLADLPAPLGAYTSSQGFETVRHEVARFIQERDGVDDASADDIFLTDGASKAAQFVLQLLTRGPGDGVMLPIPQYPLYSATMALLNGTVVPYYLDEAHQWGVSQAELRRSFAEATRQGINVRAIVIINPGNPSGACLTSDEIHGILEFAAQHSLVVIADEVYQENNWRRDKPFVSFRRVLSGMPAAFRDRVHLASLHSVSKGFLGECGLRGGYMELRGFSAAARAQLLKLVSVSLCSNTVGQVSVGLMVSPPKLGDPSFVLYDSERERVLASLRRRAAAVTAALNDMRGVQCNEIEGALYAFPRIDLPDVFVAETRDRGVAADLAYCLELLEATGIVIVPGSGFGQADGTWHFRTTILPPEEQLQAVLEKFSAFHAAFMGRFDRAD